MMSAEQTYLPREYGAGRREFRSRKTRSRASWRAASIINIYGRELGFEEKARAAIKKLGSEKARREPGAARPRSRRRATRAGIGDGEGARNETQNLKIVSGSSATSKAPIKATCWSCSRCCWKQRRSRLPIGMVKMSKSRQQRDSPARRAGVGHHQEFAPDMQT